MNPEETRRVVVTRLIEKSDQALAAARREYAAGDYSLSMNRVYYACFYATSAVLLHEKRQYAKHAGVRAALHQHLVKPGRLSAELGKFYDQAFDERQEADYEATATFDSVTVADRIDQAARFVEKMKSQLPNSMT